MLRKMLIAVAVLFAVVPAAAHASTYDWESSCFSSAVEKCWATDFSPNSGSFGDQLRDDDINSLPTLDTNGLWYGSASLNSNSESGAPETGGDYPWGGGDSTSSSCNYPAGVACNDAPSQFATQSYTDSGGAWHFAMGGAAQCESDGNEVPCNLGHRLYPYDCLSSAYSSACSSNGPQATPFNWGFPDDMYFEESANLYVGGAQGPWHAFLCADMIDTSYPTSSNPGYLIEICEEPWNSTGYDEWTHLTCGNGMTTLWQPAGTDSQYMDTSGSDSSSTGTTIAANWTMTRNQFLQLVADASTSCSGAPDDTGMDNWKLFYSENGLEEIGAAGYGAGVNWETWNEQMVTNY